MKELTIEQKALITELANDVRPEVEKIEKRIATTKDHYGDYMSLLSHFTSRGKAMLVVMGMACKEAGANSNGVDWAVKLLIGEGK